MMGDWLMAVITTQGHVAHARSSLKAHRLLTVKERRSKPQLHKAGVGRACATQYAQAHKLVEMQTGSLVISLHHNSELCTALRVLVCLYMRPGSTCTSSRGFCMRNTAESTFTSLVLRLTKSS